MNLLVILNLITVLVAGFVAIYSILLIRCLNGWYSTGWWSVLPAAFIYAAINRVFVLLISMGELPAADLSEIVAASTLPFWILMAVFVYGLYSGIRKVMNDPLGCR